MDMKKNIFFVITFLKVLLVFAQTNDTLIFLEIPKRPEEAASASEFVNQAKNLNLIDREKAIVKELISGNAPSFSRNLKAIDFTKIINNKTYKVRCFVALDYLAIGSDEDYLYIPITPSTAQFLSDKFNCMLPTKKLVDIIYNNSEIKLIPQPIPPSDKMTTMQVFFQHTDSIKKQIEEINLDREENNIIAGHKKDIIISNKIYNHNRGFDPVVIYGWHRGINNPIQPLYNGHNSMYVDYSHGIRFIYNYAIVNGDTLSIREILKDSELSNLFSNEGVITRPYYPDSDFLTSLNNRNHNYSTEFTLKQNYPNPFNPTTTISYTIPKSQNGITSSIQLKIFDVLGKEVKSFVKDKQGAGNYNIVFNAENLSGGIYFYELRTNSLSCIKKMVLVK
ncbi:MAG: hypothetical protein CR986_00355 [Ignavibacteriae bacterium]|nr:MAG: hypothetical protein CR986_00355 [Ignavibacteriota bacterium]